MNEVSEETQADLDDIILEVTNRENLAWGPPESQVAALLQLLLAEIESLHKSVIEVDRTIDSNGDWITAAIRNM